MWRIAGLGRSFAAADVGWLRVLQEIGDSVEASLGYPQLELKLDTITLLDPRFMEAYGYGATLLVTDRVRASKVDALLARGEASSPRSWELPMYRGFLAHFGRIAFADAAGHYERAAALGAPAFVGALAKTLQHSSEDCSTLRATLGLWATSTDESARLLRRESSGILESCVKRTLETAASAWRLQHGRNATVQQLVEAGLIEEPLHPPGMCWRMESGRASLIACAGGTP